MTDSAREPEIPTGPATLLLLTTGTASNGRECVALVPQYLGKDGTWRLQHSGLMLRPEHARQLAPQPAMQIGHDRDRWPMVLLKELVDKTSWPGCAGRTLLLHKDRTDGRAADDVYGVAHTGLLVPTLDGEAEVHARGETQDESVLGHGHEAIQGLAPGGEQVADNDARPNDGKLHLPELPRPGQLGGAGGIKGEAFSVTHGPSRVEDTGLAIGAPGHGYLPVHPSALLKDPIGGVGGVVDLAGRDDPDDGLGKPGLLVALDGHPHVILQWVVLLVGQAHFGLRIEGSKLLDEFLDNHGPLPSVVGFARAVERPESAGVLSLRVQPPLQLGRLVAGLTSGDPHPLLNLGQQIELGIRGGDVLRVEAVALLLAHGLAAPHCLCLPDLDVVYLIGGDQIMGAFDGFVRVGTVPIAEKLAVKPGRPDVAVAQVDYLRPAVLGDPDQKHPRHGQPLHRRCSRPSINRSSHQVSQRHGDGPPILFSLAVKEAS